MPLDRSVSQQGLPSGDPNKFPTAQLFLLSFVRVSEPIAITSIFPYAWKLVQHYNVGGQNAATYAGILIASFALAEALTSYLWGVASDKYGRKPVLLFGCCGSIVSLLVVGFSNSFWLALFGRSIGGLLNGNQGVVQTMVSELITNPAHEARAYAVMPFVWSVGTMIGPAVGGCLYSKYSSQFPALLPNVVCSAILLVAIIVGAFCIEETHPDKRAYTVSENTDNNNVHQPLLGNRLTTSHPSVHFTEDDYGTFNPIEIRLIEKDSNSHPKAFNSRVVMLIIALGIFTWHSMAYDNLIPIYFQDRRTMQDLAITGEDYTPLSGGLGLSIQDVGLIMFFNGFIALFIQAVIFPLAAEGLGIWRTFLLVTIGHPIGYAIVPLLAFIPASSTGLLNFGIYSCLAIRNLFGILAYPLVLILLKEASPSSASLGRINGAAASMGAASRTIASPVAGALYTAGSQLENTALPWFITAIVAVVGAIQVCFVGRQKEEAEVHVESVGAHVGQEVSRRISVVAHMGHEAARRASAAASVALTRERTN